MPYSRASLSWARKEIWDEKTNFTMIGLYEEETIGYPMIESGDEISLYWILEAENEKETKQSNSEVTATGDSIQPR